MRLRFWKRRPSNRSGDAPPVTAVGERGVELRITADLLARARAHIEDFSRGEEAGFLICRITRSEHCDRLLAREFIPIPESAIERYTGGSVLSWSEEFNSEMLQRAVDVDGTLVLLHSHGDHSPEFSDDDRRRELPLFAGFSRILRPLPVGTVLLGRDEAVGSFWVNGARTGRLERVVELGETIGVLDSPEVPRATLPVRKRLDRLQVAIPGSDAELAAAKVAVIGLSGGGSHVVQQLAHIGIGALICVDDQLVELTNLGRLVGAVEADAGKTLKVDVAERVAKGIDSSVTVVKVPDVFPSAQAISALKDADIVVTALDTFRARNDVNRFCRRHLIPQIDIGMQIKTKDERLASADGQVIVSMPGKTCLRCWFTDQATLDEEEAERPAGYDINPDAPGDPQVVSMNGALASEACNCVLDLVTGFSGGRRGARIWRYEGRSGTMTPYDLPSRNPSCDACAEEGLGDATGL